MALIRCVECGKEISDKSNACIHCGCPLEYQLMDVDTGATSEELELEPDAEEKEFAEISDELKLDSDAEIKEPDKNVFVEKSLSKNDSGENKKKKADL